MQNVSLLAEGSSPMPDEIEGRRTPLTADVVATMSHLSSSQMGKG